MNELTYRIRRFLYQEFTPITKGVIVLAATAFVAAFILSLMNLMNLNGYLELDPLNFIRVPWTIITYPLVNRDILSLFFSGLWLWFAGGSLERSWGGRRYGSFLFLVTLVTGVAMGLVEWFSQGGAGPIYGLWLPLVGITWAWADIIPDQEVLLMGIVPMKLKWLAWLNAAMVFFMYVSNIVLALASISGILVVYLFRRRGPYAGGYGYRNSNRDFSAKGWADNIRKRSRKNRLKVIK